MFTTRSNQNCALSDFIALPGVQLVAILPIILHIHDYVGNYATYQHLLLRSERGSTWVGWSKFIGIRVPAEGQRGHYFFWLVKQRGHDFPRPCETTGSGLILVSKTVGSRLFYPLKTTRPGHLFV